MVLRAFFINNPSRVPNVNSLSPSLSLSFSLPLLPPSFPLVIKGLSTYDYVRLQREADQRAFAARSVRQRRSFRDVCCRFHRIGRKQSRVTPSSNETDDGGESGTSSGSPLHDGPRRSRSGSGDSLGNFGRTPPPSLVS